MILKYIITTTVIIIFFSGAVIKFRAAWAPYDTMNFEGEIKHSKTGLNDTPMYKSQMVEQLKYV